MENRVGLDGELVPGQMARFQLNGCLQVLKSLSCGLFRLAEPLLFMPALGQPCRVKNSSSAKWGNQAIFRIGLTTHGFHKC